MSFQLSQDSFWQSEINISITLFQRQTSQSSKAQV